MFGLGRKVALLQNQTPKRRKSCGLTESKSYDDARDIRDPGRVTLFPWRHCGHSSGS